MKNATIQIIAKVGAGNPDADAKRWARRLQLGDIHNVFPADEHSTLTNGEYLLNDVVDSPVYSFLHVIDVPDSVQLRKLKYQERVVNATPNMDDGRENPWIVRRKKQWRTDTSLLTPILRVQLQDSSQVTITWLEFKAITHRKKVNVRADQSQDTVDKMLEDSDIG